MYYYWQTPDQNGADKKKTKKKVVKKAKGRPDEDLFGNTDDIFGAVPDEQPISAKPKKKKKKVEATGGDVGGATPDKGTEAGGDPPITDTQAAGTQEDGNVMQVSTGSGHYINIYFVCTYTCILCMVGYRYM